MSRQSRSWARHCRFIGLRYRYSRKSVCGFSRIVTQSDLMASMQPGDGRRNYEA